LLGPLLYFGLHPVVSIPFHRAMDRAFLLSALAALGLSWSRLSLRRLWPLERRSWIQFGLGYLVALVSAQTMIGLDLALGGFTSSHLSSGRIAARISMALVAALLVPPLEETVFRGFILLELVPGAGRRGAVVLSAFIFMLAHFLKIPESLDRQPVHLWSGFSAVGAAFFPVLQGDFLGGRGANLVLIGLILGGIFLRLGTLWFNAGLHSGWILALLLFSGLTRPASPPHLAVPGGGDLLSSPITSLVLIGVAGWLWYFYPPRGDASGGRPASGAGAPSS
jgi:membrane protease YdiL (CAAX protease family)